MCFSINQLRCCKSKTRQSFWDSILDDARQSFWDGVSSNFKENSSLIDHTLIYYFIILAGTGQWSRLFLKMEFQDFQRLAMRLLPEVRFLAKVEMKYKFEYTSFRTMRDSKVFRPNFPTQTSKALPVVPKLAESCNLVHCLWKRP